MRSRNSMLWVAVHAVVAAIVLPLSVSDAAPVVFNGDFDADADLFLTWPGYVADGANPAEIPDWFGSGGRGINPVQPEDGAVVNPASISNWTVSTYTGINPVEDLGADDPAPFRDNGENDTTAAFLQGTAFIQQDVANLAVGADYALSLDFNARDCCGDFPIARLALNGQIVPDFPDPGLFLNGVVEPAGDGFDWYHAEIPFTADDTNLRLTLSAEASMGLDATLLIDNVSLVRSGGGPDLIVNGDFEADAGRFPQWPGYVTDESQRAPFRDNGGNKTNVAFMQGQATLEQDVTGFEVGEEYSLSFDYNARNCCDDKPMAELQLDGVFIDEFADAHPDGIDPVGGDNPWHHFETAFIAQGQTINLTFSASPAGGGDATFLLDNVRIDRVVGPPIPFAGDADLDRDFDQLDLVQVQIAGKYLTAQAATWGEGDWNGAPDPNSSFEAPPAGDGFFNQLDIISALGANVYLTGPYAALKPSGETGDSQTSVGYDANTGEVWVDAPAGVDLTSINIDSASGIFTGDPAQNLGGSFDNDADNNIFKATFGGSFGSIRFGRVAQSGLSEDLVLNDLTVVGSLDGGGPLGEVDLIYVPEPATVLLLGLGGLGLVSCRLRRVKFCSKGGRK